MLHRIRQLLTTEGSTSANSCCWSSRCFSLLSKVCCVVELPFLIWQNSTNLYHTRWLLFKLFLDLIHSTGVSVFLYSHQFFGLFLTLYTIQFVVAHVVRRLDLHLSCRLSLQAVFQLDKPFFLMVWLDRNSDSINENNHVWR